MIYIYITIHIICILQHVQIYTVYIYTYIYVFIYIYIYIYIYMCTHILFLRIRTMLVPSQVVQILQPIAAIYENVQGAAQCTKSKDKKTTHPPAVEVSCLQHISTRMSIYNIYIYIYIFERCAGCNHLEQCWFQHLENSKNTYCQFLSYIHMYKFLSMHMYMYIYIYECV